MVCEICGGIMDAPGLLSLISIPRVWISVEDKATGNRNGREVQLPICFKCIPYMNGWTSKDNGNTITHYKRLDT